MSSYGNENYTQSTNIDKNGVDTVMYRKESIPKDNTEYWFKNSLGDMQKGTYTITLEQYPDTYKHTFISNTTNIDPIPTLYNKLSDGGKKTKRRRIKKRRTRSRKSKKRYYKKK